MIKLPKEVTAIIETLEERGFPAYAVGGCVRDSLLGEQPLDFDLAAGARPCDLKAIFPEAAVINERLGVIRFNCISKDAGEGMIVDVASLRVEGHYSDHRRPDTVEFTDSIEADLKRRDFTINAMADSPGRPFVDLYGGREDLKARLIRTVGEPGVRFEEDPLRMMRAVRFAAELDFDLHQSVLEAICEKGALLSAISRDRIRWEFEKILLSNRAGKGLKMLAETRLMDCIVGSEHLSRRESGNFVTLTESIDKTINVLEHRLGLFYLCFDDKRALAAINAPGYDRKARQHLIDAIRLLDKLSSIVTKYEIKIFMAEYGRERYEYLDKLSKAQRIVRNLSDIKIKNRDSMLKEILTNNEPVFKEDLAVSGSDLLEAGISEGEKIGEILLMLTDMVRKKPGDNNRKALLELAQQFTKAGEGNIQEG